MAKQIALTELVFPIGGLNRAAAFQSQPPFTTPYCVNVRPFDVVNLASAQMHGMRQRGGARPGLTKTYAQQISDGPIQLLNYASRLDTDGTSTNILLAIADGTLYQNASGAFAVVTGGPQFNTTAKQLRGVQVGEKFYVADYRPVNLIGTKTGTITNTNRLSDSGISDWTALGIDTAKDVVWISGSIDTESNIFPISSVAAGYIVFGGTMTDQVGSVTWQVGRLPKIFDPAAPTGALAGLMGSLPIPRSNYRTGTVTAVNGVVTLSGGSWVDVPAVTPLNMVTLTIPNASGIGERQYLVSSKDSNTRLTLIDQTDDADCSAVTYELSWTSDYYGLPPLNCNLCCVYRGRLMLAGPGAIWYMGRVLNPQDWDYGYDPSDPSRPVGGTATTTGGIPDPVLALMPHSDDYLIFGCERSLWLLNGDPAYGGNITCMSREIGVLGPDAWCNLPDGSMLIFSRDGLYQLAPGGGAYPKPLSREFLPGELLETDWVSNTISMVYDAWARGVHLSITPAAGTTGKHFFFDTTLGRFWPVILPDVMQPTAMIQYSANATVSAKIVLAGYDGYVRHWDPDATSDDGTTIVSAVCYGPFRPGGPGYLGEILQIAADLDTNGQPVSWGIFQGDTAQAAVQAAVTGGVATAAPWTGTWQPGPNHRQFPRALGAAHVLMVSGTYRWAVEGIRVEARRKGPWR